METAFINLTEDDFKLLVKGLDAIENAESSTELLADIFLATKSDNPKAFAQEREEKKKKKSVEREIHQETVRILQGKILSLKRYLQQNGALNETTNILQFIK